MIDRRTLLAGLAALPFAAQAQPLVSARIGAAPRDLPVIGLGTARRWEEAADAAALGALRDTLSRFVALGGSVIDTAPSYGRAEELLGRLIAELSLRDRLFIATKVGADDRASGEAQIADSFRNLRMTRIDMIAVHNLRDITNQLAYLRTLKAAGRIGFIGATTSFDRQYPDFEAMMRREPLDLIQVDYALDNRGAADRIIPLAQERGMAVMVNLPFGRGRLFEATRGRALPDWAGEIGATSWAQIFLKYIVSHPARPIAIPGMAQVRYVEDNLPAARPPLPDAAMRRRMEAFIDAL